jgi:CubicO group peptidase (beta-lactamase class C family)
MVPIQPHLSSAIPIVYPLSPMRTFSFFVAAIALILLGGAPSAQPDPRHARVDALFAEWDKPDSPGCAVGIVRDGGFVYSRGYGSANLDYGIPITPASVFDIASVSKQFTTAAVVLLAERDQLSLDDDIRTHLPEMPDYGTPITIRHLIHHTSGIRDYLTLMNLMGLRVDDVHPEEEIYELVARQENLNFRPGDEYLYSNSGYFLLAVIAKRVSGAPLGPFSTEQLFEPLGMRSTRIFDDRTLVVRNRAIGYSPKPDGGFGVNYTPNVDFPGDGQVYTTIEDLLLWDRNFYEPVVGGERLVRTLLQVGRLNNGDEIDYAGGLRVSRYRGLRTVSHGGSWAGYRAELLRFPDERFTVAVLCNLSSIAPGVLARRTADIYLEDRLQPMPQAAAPGTAMAGVVLTAEDLKRLTGAYRNAVSEAIWLIEERAGRLRARPGPTTDFALVPVGDRRFRADDTPVSMTLRFEGSPAARFAMEVEGEKPQIFERVTLVRPTGAELAAFEGEYYSSELDTLYRMTVQDEALVVRRRRAHPLMLEATIRDTFRGGGFSLTFTREADRVTGLRIAAGRVKDIRFQRRQDGLGSRTVESIGGIRQHP